MPGSLSPLAGASWQLAWLTPADEGLVALWRAASFEEWSMAATKLDQMEGHTPEEQRARFNRETRLCAPLPCHP